MNPADQETLPTNKSPWPVLPDENVCRTRPSGFGQFTDCLVPAPDRCPYALSFGYTYFCQHPERLNMAAAIETGKARPV